MICKALSRCSLSGVLFSVLALSSFAQSYRGQVRGLVLDQTGAALPGANVALANVKTGVSSNKQTDSSGLYVFDYVEPGAYTVTVESTGFGKYVQENVAVQSGGDVTVNATLSPGTLQQSVTVEAAPAAVEFNSSNQE